MIVNGQDPQGITPKPRVGDPCGCEKHPDGVWASFIPRWGMMLCSDCVKEMQEYNDRSRWNVIERMRAADV